MPWMRPSALKFVSPWRAIKKRCAFCGGSSAIVSVIVAAAMRMGVHVLGVSGSQAVMLS